MKFVKNTVKLGDKERLDSKQTGNSEPFCQFTLKIVNNLGLVNNFAMAKKFLITKFDCKTIFENKTILKTKI